jgi:hypothetical protein
MNYLYSIALSMWLTSAAFAQAPTSPRPTVQITEKSTVIDAAGAPLSYAVWRQLVGNGYYKMQAAPGSSAERPVFQVVARTEAERAEYLAKLPPPDPSPFFTTGQALAPFKLRDLSGRKYDSKELAGKIVVLNFWFIGCPPCRILISWCRTMPSATMWYFWL